MRVLETASPRAAGRLSFLIFRVTQRHPMPERERRWTESAEPLELELDGRPVRGWSWGAGPAVLLMHGWGGRGTQMGGLARSIAGAGLRAIALDAPGHGVSAGRLSSLPQFAATVALAARRFGPLRGVVAHSFGAAGMGWALREPLEIERLVFIAAPGDMQGYVSGFRELVGLSDRGMGHLIASLEQRFDVDWQRSRRATTIHADGRPVLVVHDTFDDETPYAGGLRIRRAWPNSRLLSTGGLGHRRILRDGRVRAEVTRFLSAEAHAVEPAASGAERAPAGDLS